MGEGLKRVAKECGGLIVTSKGKTVKYDGDGNIVAAKTRPTTRLTLAYLQRKPEAQRRFEGKRVRIWSGQWQSWWRPEGNGYTNLLVEAGVYTFEDAWRRSSHCGPEKRISYVVVSDREPRSLQEASW